MGGLALLLLALAAPAAAEVKIEATLNPESVGVDEVATFSIEARGGGFDHVSFEPSVRLENFALVAGPETAENISFVDGALSRSFRVSWELRPRVPGKARVRASIKLDGAVIQLPVREIAIASGAAGATGAPNGDPNSVPNGVPNAGGAAPAQPGQDEQDPFSRIFGSNSPLSRFFEPPRQRQAAPPVFLRAEVVPERPYAGQQALWTLYLYTRAEINAINQESVPSFHGFWVHDIPQPQSLPHDMVDIGGERFARVPLMRKALFALHPGVLVIDPVDVELMARAAQTGFWGTTLDPPAPVQVRAPALRVEARPLPPAPPEFHGAVGRVAMRASLAPRDLRLGEAATLTVTLSGDGHLSGVPAPALALPPGLKLLPPQQQGEDAFAGTTVRGERSWSFAVIPERTGSFRIAVPPEPYFDPQAGEYRAAAVPAFELSARPAPASVAAPARRSSAPPPRDVPSADTPQAWTARWNGVAGRLGPRGLPWLFAALGGVAALVVLARRRGASSGMGGMAWGIASGNGGLTGAAAAHLAEAAAAEHPRRAAAALEAAVGEMLAARWSVPAGTPPRHWRALAAARGADPATTADLGRLADDLHYLRNAPQLSATAALQSEALASCRRLLRR